MNWVDVAGPPGCGKSTLCYPITKDREVMWQGTLPPRHWQLFFDEITTLCTLVKDHGTLEAVVRMNTRSAGKMTEVYFSKEDKVFVQTAFAQRILGFGWRLHDMGADINLIRRAFQLMPVSIGVVVLEASPEVIKQRNADREKVKETAHENRWGQVPHMLPCIEVMKDELDKRGVPVISIDTEQPINVARKQLVEFSERYPFDEGLPPVYDNNQMTALPVWWQR